MMDRLIIGLLASIVFPTMPGSTCRACLAGRADTEMGKARVR